MSRTADRFIAGLLHEHLPSYARERVDPHTPMIDWKGLRELGDMLSSGERALVTLAHSLDGSQRATFVHWLCLVDDTVRADVLKTLDHVLTAAALVGIDDPR